MMLSYFKCSHHLAGLTLLYNHKESTAREERGWGRRFFHRIEPTVTDPCRIVPCQYHGWGMPGRRARSPIAFYARVQCREPKTGLERVQFYCEDDILFLSSYYLSMTKGHACSQSSKAGVMNSEITMEHRISIQPEGKRGGGGALLPSNWT